MGVISKGGIRGGGGRPGRACQHCDICILYIICIYICITTICRKTGVPENPLPVAPET